MTEGKAITRQNLFSPIIHTILSGVLTMPEMEKLSKHVIPRFRHAKVWAIEAFELESFDKGPRGTLGELFQVYKKQGGDRVVFFSDSPIINLAVSRLALSAGLSMPAVRTREEYQAEIMKPPPKP